MRDCYILNVFYFIFSLAAFSQLQDTGSLLQDAGFSHCGTWAPKLFWHIWDLSSQTRDQTCVPCFGRRTLSHGLPGKSREAIIFIQPELNMAHDREFYHSRQQFPFAWYHWQPRVKVGTTSLPILCIPPSGVSWNNGEQLFSPPCESVPKFVTLLIHPVIFIMGWFPDVLPSWFAFIICHTGNRSMVDLGQSLWLPSAPSLTGWTAVTRKWHWHKSSGGSIPPRQRLCSSSPRSLHPRFMHGTW